MSSKILGRLRKAVAVTLLAGGLVAAGAGVACADSQSVDHDGATPMAASKPIKAPDRGPVGPVTVSGEQAGNDGAVTVTTDGTTVVVSGRAHLESPVDQAGGGVVHHDEDTGSPLGNGRDVGLGTDQLGFAGGVTGDSSSVDAVVTLASGRRSTTTCRTGPERFARISYMQLRP